MPGIGLSPDKILLARGFSYADAHRARLGTNYKQLRVNSPKVEVHSYSKDGAMRVKVSDPVYAPNSYGGPLADPSRAAEVRWYKLRKDDDDWSQSGTWCARSWMTARGKLSNNIVGHVCKGVKEPVLSRVFEYWRIVDPISASR